MVDFFLFFYEFQKQSEEKARNTDTEGVAKKTSKTQQHAQLLRAGPQSTWPPRTCGYKISARVGAEPSRRAPKTRESEGQKATGPDKRDKAGQRGKNKNSRQTKKRKREAKHNPGTNY